MQPSKVCRLGNPGWKANKQVYLSTENDVTELRHSVTMGYNETPCHVSGLIRPIGFLYPSHGAGAGIWRRGVFMKKDGEIRWALLSNTNGILMKMCFQRIHFLRGGGHFSATQMVF